MPPSAWMSIDIHHLGSLLAHRRQVFYSFCDDDALFPDTNRAPTNGPVWPHLRFALKLHGPRFQTLVAAEAIVGGYAKKRKTTALLAKRALDAIKKEATKNETRTL